MMSFKRPLKPADIWAAHMQLCRVSCPRDCGFTPASAPHWNLTLLWFYPAHLSLLLDPLREDISSAQCKQHDPFSFPCNRCVVLLVSMAGLGVWVPPADNNAKICMLSACIKAFSRCWILNVKQFLSDCTYCVCGGWWIEMYSVV